MSATRFGVAHGFLWIGLGAAGVAAGYRFESPLGLLGLVLIVAGVAGWCAPGNAGEPDRARRPRPAPADLGSEAL